jgi:homoserine O-acetyltransferase
VQEDLNEGLAPFFDKQFDYVVLSQTLQAVTDVSRLIKEMLRVGRYGVVSFPNLGYSQYRRQLAEEGVAPRVGGVDGYDWHNTPNLRFLSIVDFERFCENHGYQIQTRLALDTSTSERVREKANEKADVAIMVLQDRP